MYLMIENVNECPVECFTILGASMTRNQSTDSTIGQFGSGLKHGMMTMLRNGIDMIAFSGNRKIVFGYEPMKITNAQGTNEFQQVFCRIDGKKEKLSFVLEHGVLDWNQVAMGLREFVSNAIDATTLAKLPVSDIIIKKVAPGNIGGVAGRTRIFLKLHDNVQEYVDKINRSFLHFTGNEKKEYVSNVGENCRIYKRGVLVNEMKIPSVFHYNSRHIRLDESRNADSYICKSTIGNIISDMLVDDLTKVFLSVSKNTNIVEYSVPEFSLTFGCKAADAWKKAFGEGVLCCNNNVTIAQFLKEKGLTPIMMPPAYYDNLVKVKGITTDMNYRTTDNEECFPPTDAMVSAVRKAWDLCGMIGYRCKTFPKVMSFKPQMNAASQVYGRYHNNIVYLHSDLEGKLLFKTALEEVVHHITGSTDMSRDFQEYLFTIITEFAY